MAGGQNVWETVKAFVVENGGAIDERLEVDSKGVRGLCTNADILENTPLFQIPQVCMMDGAGMKQSLDPFKTKNPISDLCLAFSLLKERKNGASSFFASYLATLPSHNDFTECLPSWWSEDLRNQLLKGSPILNDIEIENTNLLHDYSLLSKTIAQEYSLEDLKWSLAVIGSRAFVKPSSNGSNNTNQTDDSEVPCLIPAMDMMNHGRPCVARFSFEKDDVSNKDNDDKSSFKMIVKSRDKKIESGKEVTITYGAKSAVNLLRLYGFTLPSNVDPDGSSNDLRVLKFSLPQKQSNYQNNEESTTECEGSKKKRKIAEDEDEDDLFEAIKGRWYSGNNEDVRVVQLRLASSAAPKHYIFTPFTKALDACRVLTFKPNRILGYDDDDEDDNNEEKDGAGGFSNFEEFEKAGQGMEVWDDVAEDDDDDDEIDDDDDDADDDMLRVPSNSAMLPEIDAIDYFIGVLKNELAEYSIDEISSSSSSDCSRLLRREVLTLQYYHEASVMIKDLLAVMMANHDDLEGWRANVTNIFTTRTFSSNTLTEEDEKENPLLYPLAPITVLVGTYFQIKFSLDLKGV